MTAKQIGLKLERTIYGVRDQIRRMGLTDETPKWTDAEKKYVKDNIGKKKTSEIAKKLGKTVVAVRTQKRNIISKMKKRGNK